MKMAVFTTIKTQRRSVWVLMSLMLIHIYSTNAQDSSTVHAASNASSTPTPTPSTTTASSSYSSSSSSSSSISTSAQASSSTPSPTTTPKQTLCSVTDDFDCAKAFPEIYAKNKTDPTLKDASNQLVASLHCDPTLFNNPACAIKIATDQCTQLKTATKQQYVNGANKNFTHFALMCFNQQLIPIAYDPTAFACTPTTSNAINKTTVAICGLAGKLSDGVNSTSHFNLFCRDGANGNEVTDVDPVSMLASWYSLHDCGYVPPTTINIPLSPNPVSREAITAIVVLVCLAIVAVLAAFFFWPKCHISDPKLIPKTKKKERDGMINEGFDFEGATGGAQYKAGKDAVRLPPTFGPQAA